VLELDHSNMRVNLQCEDVGLLVAGIKGWEAQ
jgi:hypothetical protein